MKASMNAKRPVDLAKLRRQRRAADYVLHDQIGFILRVANQFATTVFQGVVRVHFGKDVVTTTQFAVLVTLWERGDLALSDLGGLTAMDPATLQEVVRRLMRREFLTIRDDPHDRRRRLAQLTQRGKILAFRLRAMGTDVSSAVLTRLDDSERGHLLGLLRKMADRAEAEDDLRGPVLKTGSGRGDRDGHG
jgi:MarR family transcriptional regulator, lower aerobic nicotinate degradation pathway regulator